MTGDGGQPGRRARPRKDGQALLSRREMLVAAGALGFTLGAAGEAALPPILRRVSGLDQQTDVAVRVHGGEDRDGARANALKVWENSQPARKAHLTASYQSVGVSSTDQIAAIENLLARDPVETDLVVVDPEYLPGLVQDNRLRALDDVLRSSLDDDLRSSLDDAGVFTRLLDRCEVDGHLNAVPLNADVPLLAVDVARLGTAEAGIVDRLRRTTDPRAFWSDVLAMAAKATKAADAPALRLHTRDYEGLTVCLVELVDAFGGDVSSDPTLTSQRSRTALRDLRGVAGPLALDASSADEDVILAEFAEHHAVFARLWPAQFHSLKATAPPDEAAGGFQSVPIPGGVLGGQVMAVADASPQRGAATDLAIYLAQPASQLQLFHGGGYVPTVRQLYTDLQVRYELTDLADRIESAARRPALPQYAAWSARFRSVVRRYLLGSGASLDDVTGALEKVI